jgi:hypothetical protein
LIRIRHFHDKVCVHYSVGLDSSSVLFKFAVVAFFRCMMLGVRC